MKTLTSLMLVALSVCVLGPTSGFAKHHHHHHKHHHHDKHQSTEQKVKEEIQDVADSMKKEVDKLGDNLAAIQDYLDHYHWKGVIQGEASSGPATLSHMILNDHHRGAVVRPGDTVQGEVICTLDPQKCSSLQVYRVVVGLKGVGPQTTIAPSLGALGGRTLERFTLTAPQEPGVYQVRFRCVENLLETCALDKWKDAEGNEPDAKTTMGVLIVRKSE